jgi:Arylsulfotransferase (ASST)
MTAGAIRRTIAACGAGAAMMAAAACGNDGPTQSSGTRVGITDVDVISRAAPENVLSAPVVFQVEGADSVRVLYAPLGGSARPTPARPATDTPDTLVLLGLQPRTTYVYRLQAFAGSEVSYSATRTFVTAALPADLATVRMQRISGGTRQYALTTARARYAVAFDSAGNVAWYHDFGAGLPVSNALRQPNGDVTVFVGATSGWSAAEGYYLEITPDGQPVRTWRAPAGEYMDDHDIRVLGSGEDAQAEFFTYTIRPADLTALGGLPGVQLAGHSLERVDAAGNVLFRWDAWDRIGVDEWRGDQDAKSTRTATDFDHPNSLSLDPAGNYVVSWRNLDQVMGIDRQTGAVLWRVGGAKGEYTFVGDPEGGFSKQHSAKVLPNGDLLVYDNGTDHTPQETRVAEYRLDPAAKTATLVWQYRHSPAIWTQFVGWTERLPGGDTWVAFALAGRAVEVDPAGRTVWEAQLRVDDTDGSAYRIVPIPSLY